MVSRFPNGSPIECDGNDYVLAEFSRDVTKADLVDKVKLIFVSLPDVLTMVSEASAQVESEDILVMKVPGGTPAISLKIHGNQLITSESGGWFFDIDFDNQHRKFFEKSSGTYLMQLPNIIEQATPTERYAVVRVTNVLETSSALSVAILISSNNEPWSGDAELSDIDVAAFFDDNIALTSVEDIIKAVLKMEYYIPSGVTFNVVNTAEESVSVDGGLWNLFTDGSVYVPLMLTSRLPNGSPLIVNEDSDDPAIVAPKKVCTFNRPTTYTELLWHTFKASTTNFVNTEPRTVPFVKYGESQYCFGNNQTGGVIVELRNNGTELWVPSAGKIWNVDLDSQYKRPFQIVDEGESEDWAFRTIPTPDFINDSPYLFVLAYKTDGERYYIYTPKNANDEIRVFDPRTNSYVYRQSETQLLALSYLIETIYRQEFELPACTFGSGSDLPEDLPNGSFDVFIDSEVIV